MVTGQQIQLISRDGEAWQQMQKRVHKQRGLGHWSADAAYKQGQRSLAAAADRVHQQLRETAAALPV